MNWRKTMILLLALLFLPAAASTAEQREEEAAVLKGAALFSANCAKCHGAKGVGTKDGPPLVHKIYHPNHHADISFRWAIERGVRAHHWNFGDMPKIDGIKPDEATAIIEYVRSIQKEAGIF